VDTEYPIDYDEIVKTVRTADVVLFRFVTVPMRVLIDNRTSDVDGPMAKLVPRVESAEERFKSVKLLRPRFKLPRKICAIWWPRYVRSLNERGIWDVIVARMAEAGHPAAARDAEAALQGLLLMERTELRNAIVGEGYDALWPVEAR